MQNVLVGAGVLSWARQRAIVRLRASNLWAQKQAGVCPAPFRTPVLEVRQRGPPQTVPGRSCKLLLFLLVHASATQRS